MKTLRGAEADALLRIDDALVERLRTMAATGAPAGEMIEFMCQIGITKPGAIVALRRSGVIDANEAKRAVHFSEAYAARRESDERFEESVLCAVEQLDTRKAAA